MASPLLGSLLHLVRMHWDWTLAMYVPDQRLQSEDIRAAPAEDEQNGAQRTDHVRLCEGIMLAVNDKSIHAGCSVRDNQ